MVPMIHILIAIIFLAYKVYKYFYCDIPSERIEICSLAFIKEYFTKNDMLSFYNYTGSILANLMAQVSYQGEVFSLQLIAETTLVF